MAGFFGSQTPTVAEPPAPLVAFYRGDLTRFKYFGNGEWLQAPYEFKKFGQVLALPNDYAIEMIKAGGAILTEEQWNAVGFTPDHKSNQRNRAGEAYMVKHRLAMEKRKDLLESLQGAGS
jgi:hypothetical protein